MSLGSLLLLILMDGGELFGTNKRDARSRNVLFARIWAPKDDDQRIVEKERKG